jgi:hypothetical protein
MAKRYSTTPWKLARSSPEEFDFNLGVYFWAQGERALDEAWRRSREKPT